MKDLNKYNTALDLSKIGYVKSICLIIKYFKNNKLQNIIWLLFSLHEIDTFLVYNKNIYDYDIRILSFNTKIVDFKTFKQIHFTKK